MHKIKNQQQGFGIVEVLLVILVLALLGVIGWLVYQNQISKGTSSPSTSQTDDSYAGWKTYSSPQEKLSFKYPADWTQTTAAESNVPGGDSFAIKSPSSAVTLSWISAIDGLGGVCDDTVAPGVEGPEGTFGCAKWDVLEKQKLSGANLYYVAGIVTTDNTTYTPWCALQSETGILTSGSYLGFLLFDGKNNIYVEDGKQQGPFNAGFSCGKIPGGSGFTKGTKAEATAFWSTNEAKQAKLILTSATYQ